MRARESHKREVVLRLQGAKSIVSIPGHWVVVKR